MISVRKRRKRERIDEYDLGDRLRRWAKLAMSQAITFVLVHPKTVAFSGLGVVALSVTWWFVANYRPAEPPAPRERPMRMMMNSVEEADRRVRERLGNRVEQGGQVRGVFETMRDMPVPLSAGSREAGSQPESKSSEEQP